METATHEIDGAAPEAGQTMAEYSVVLAVITLAIITAFAALSGSTATLLQRAANLI